MENSEKIVVTDRYQATGTPYPDPATMCQGPCEGMGFYPVQEGAPDLTDYEREQIAGKTTDDGWHFITCPDCKGTRVRA